MLLNENGDFFNLHQNARRGLFSLAEVEGVRGNGFRADVTPFFLSFFFALDEIFTKHTITIARANPCWEILPSIYICQAAPDTSPFFSNTSACFSARAVSIHSALDSHLTYQLTRWKKMFRTVKDACTRGGFFFLLVAGLDF